MSADWTASRLTSSTADRWHRTHRKVIREKLMSSLRTVAVDVLLCINREVSIRFKALDHTACTASKQRLKPRPHCHRSQSHKVAVDFLSPSRATKSRRRLFTDFDFGASLDVTLGDFWSQSRKPGDRQNMNKVVLFKHQRIDDTAVHRNASCQGCQVDTASNINCYILSLNYAANGDICSLHPRNRESDQTGKLDV